jgi:DNA replication protein DnaC
MNPFKELIKQSLDSIEPISDDELEKKQTAENQEKINEKIKELIPKRYHQAEVRNKEILDFFRTDKLFLWIHGFTGSGKTESVYALMRLCITKHINSRFFMYNESTINYETRFVGIPIIDDLWLSANAKRKENLLDIYYELINEKYEHGLQLIITSNFSPDTWLDDAKKINSQMTNRITSRFSKNIQIVDLGKNDYRR